MVESCFLHLLPWVSHSSRQKNLLYPRIIIRPTCKSLLGPGKNSFLGIKKKKKSSKLMTAAEWNCHWHIIFRISCCEWSREGVYSSLQRARWIPGPLSAGNCGAAGKEISLPVRALIWLGVQQGEQTGGLLSMVFIQNRSLFNQFRTSRL